MDEQAYHAKLAEAERLLARAWQMDKADPRAPTVMLTVKLARAGNWREEMEQWFARAMEADPDNFAACARKLLYLSPSRHGSAEEMLAFGRQCLASKNWVGGLPLILVRAHQQLAEAAEDRGQYFQQPAVWDDLREVYQTGLEVHPGDAHLRGEYAKTATVGGQWATAGGQFQILGDQPDLGVFASMASYDYLRKKASRLARPPPAEPN